MIEGKIVKIISNLYTIKTSDEFIECRARGKFRHEKITPLVGDFCLVDAKNKYILEIKERKNYLTRPMIANVDVALIMTSVKEPDLSLHLLDKLISMVTMHDIEPVICFSKVDLMSTEEMKVLFELKNYYQKCGIKTYYNSEVETIKEYLQNKIVVLTGQTGAGKSTFLNSLDQSLDIETSPISKALGRGVHTTRHVELYEIAKIFFADTPGFSSLDLSVYEKEQIRFSFIEFSNYECKFRDCNHINETVCGVKDAVQKQEILESRYINYQSFFREGK